MYIVTQGPLHNTVADFWQVTTDVNNGWCNTRTSYVSILIVVMQCRVRGSVPVSVVYTCCAVAVEDGLGAGQCCHCQPDEADRGRQDGVSALLAGGGQRALP